MLADQHLLDCEELLIMPEELADRDDLIIYPTKQYKKYMRPEQDMLCFSEAELEEIVENFMHAARLLEFASQLQDGTENAT